MNILLYGAYGYTGRRIADLAKKRGVELILAGRNGSKLSELLDGDSNQLRTFSLDDSNEICSNLEDVDVVLHAAGPFEQTAQPMVDACLKTKTHYLDITGEITVFEELKLMDSEAKNAEIMLLPGAGFDVVPTDMIARKLSKMLPDATHLELAFAPINSQISHGTLTTMIKQLGESGASRYDGEIVQEPIGKSGKWIDFKIKKRFTMTIPWGDVSTAHWSTKIPNIKVFTSVSPSFFKLMKAQFLVNPLLKMDVTKNLLQKWVDSNVDGPDDKTIEEAYTLVKGTVWNSSGDTQTIMLRCPESYTLTAETALRMAERTANEEFKTGYQTPATAYDFSLLTDIDGVEII
jgi:short subunit dehydrogenase-like uncharacterized protein